MTKPVRLGIAGLGRAGLGMHVPELSYKTEMFKITAVCDVIEERRHDTANKLNCKSYEKIEDLIHDDEVDIVDIATRSCDHFKHTKMALLAGKSVFLEKPMCETYEEADELVKLTKTAGSPKLYIRHNRRFEANFMFIKEIIKNKKIGDVYEININRAGYQRRIDWQTLNKFGGGQLLNWGPHIIDQSLGFIDYNYTDMFSDLKHIVAAGDCEDHVNISFKGENGILVNMKISGGIALGLPEYLVYGSKGALEIGQGKIKIKYIDPACNLPPPVANPETPYPSFGSTGTFSQKEVIQWVEETIDSPQDNLTVIWDYLYDSYLNGKVFPITLEESAMVMKVISDAKSK